MEYRSSSLLTMRLCVLTTLMIGAFLTIPAEACMQFSITAPQLVGIVTVGIIFSPVLLTGAVIYHTGKAVGNVVHKAKDAIHDAQVRRRHEPNRDPIDSLDHARLALTFSTAAFDDQQEANTDDEEAPVQTLWQLAQQASEQPTHANVMRVASCMFTLYEDYIGAYAQFQRAAGIPGISNEERGIAIFMQGLSACRMNLFLNAYRLFRTAEVLLPHATSSADDVPHPFYAHFATFQAGWVALLLHLYPFMQAPSDAADRPDVDSQPPNIDAAISAFDRCAAVDAEDVAARFYAGVARFYHSKPLPNEPLCKEALKLLNSIPDSDAMYGAKAVAMQALCLALLGNLREAKELQRRSIDMDPTIHRPLLENHEHQPRIESILAPWPVPKELYNGFAGAHKWKETRFLKPTWCDRCMKFVTLGQNMDKCFECTACGLNCHRHCKEEIGDAPQCLAAIRKPAFEKGAAVKMGKMIGNVDYLYPDGLVAVNWTAGKLRGTSTRVMMAQLESLESGKLAQSHTHVLRKTELFKPTWCDACGKFIRTMDALKCEQCRAVVHIACSSQLGCTTADVAAIEPSKTLSCKS